MTDEELQFLVEKISMQFFNKPFIHKATFNQRLRTTGGRYSLTTHNIDINPKQLYYFGEEELIKIIKHELCHYHLHLENKGYMHKDQDFKQLLQKVGGSRYCKTLPNIKRGQSRKMYLYKCSTCHTEFKRKRRFDIKKYVCGKCKGKIKLERVIS